LTHVTHKEVMTPSPGSQARGWLWAVQGLVTLAVVALVARSIGRNWAEFRSLHAVLTIKPVWIAGSALAVSASYAMHIESWRRILLGWGQRIAFGAAARTWSLANLGRYVPGKVWSVAGLVVLAQRAGVQMAPAAASAFVSQALAVGTGAAVVAAVTPHATSPLRLAAAGLAALATVGVLTWAPTARWLGRLASASAPLEPLRPTALVTSATLTTLGWVTYGAAFWLLARGLLATAAFTLWPALLSLPMLRGLWLADSWSDQYTGGFAWHTWSAEWFRRLGHLPLWDPEVFGGLPFAAGHGNAFYPTWLLRFVI